MVDDSETTAASPTIGAITAAHPRVEIIGVAHEERARDLVAARAHPHLTHDKRNAVA